MPDTDGLLAAAQGAHDRGALAKAQELLERAARVAPNDARVWIRLGHLLCDRELYANSIAAFESAIALAPDHAAAHSGMARALEMTGRDADAHAHLRTSVSLAPTAPRLVLLADAERRLGMGDEACRTLERALELEPDNEEALCNLGALLAKQDGQRSIELLRRAISVDPLYALAHRELGSALTRLKRLDEAEHHLRTAVHLKEADPWSRLQLGNLLWFRGNNQEAEAEYRAACDLDPLWVFARSAFGEFLEAVGRSDDAEPWFRAAVEVGPTDPDATFRLGAFLLRSERKDEGMRWLHRTLELEPGHMSAQRLMGDSVA